MKRPETSLADLTAFRKSLDENQTEFWARFGVTQSGGSRYESGRALPKSVALLVLAFAHNLLDDEKLLALNRDATRSAKTA